jgi:hypothetical protein
VLAARITLLICLVPGNTKLSAQVGRMAAQAGQGPLRQVDSIRVLESARHAVAGYVDAVGGSSGDAASVLQGCRLHDAGCRTSIAQRLRPGLIERLDAFGRAIPGDDWIMRHRVGLRVKQGLPGDALDVLRNCRASDWWCAALTGFVLHQLGRVTESEAAFDSALDRMPPDIRCAWAEEVVHLLDDDFASQYRSADCVTRKLLEDRIWWLADPLHLSPGNDRRTEHLSRVVAMRFHHDYLDLVDRTCEPAHHEMILRHGWPEWWWSSVGNALDPYRPAGSGFMPTAVAASGAVGIRALGQSENTMDLTFGERYTAPYGPVRSLEQQTAFFARGDSLLVVAAAAVEQSGGTAAVMLSRDAHDPPLMLRDTFLVSLEVQSPAHGASRARFFHRLPDASPRGLSLSDLLVFDWADALPEHIDAVFPRMSPSTRLRTGAQIGLYWELYGTARLAGVTFALRMRPERGGVIRRLGELLRLVARRDAIALEWDEPAAGAFMRKQLRLDLSGLAEGRYTLELEAMDAGGDRAVTRREVEIARE